MVGYGKIRSCFFINGGEKIEWDKNLLAHSTDFYKTFLVLLKGLELGNISNF
jgi:hypothetical protein